MLSYKDWGLCVELQEKACIGIKKIEKSVLFSTTQHLSSKWPANLNTSPSLKTMVSSPKTMVSDYDHEANISKAEASIMRKKNKIEKSALFSTTEHLNLKWSLNLNTSPSCKTTVSDYDHEANISETEASIMRKKNNIEKSALFSTAQHLSSKLPLNLTTSPSPKTTVSDYDHEPNISEAEASIMRKFLRSHLVKNSHNVEVQQKDPDSPLYSVKSFEELKLSKELLKGVYNMKFNFPSKIQETALPLLLVDPPQNMIAQSQSGTGKTAAFILACLSRIEPKNKYPQVLILSPTLELAKQTGLVAESMAKFCPEIKFCVAVRGQLRDEKIQAQFLIGTPGKVLDWLKKKYFDIKKITVFVLDEADVMISLQGHQDQSIRIHKNHSSTCQMLFFSATYSEDVMEFAGLIVPDPVIIRLKREEESLENIKQYYIDVSENLSANEKDYDIYTDGKYAVIENIYGIMTIGQSIIFCRTRKAAVWLYKKLNNDGHAVAMLSGELTTNERIDILSLFRLGKTKILITTNVCARGIDVEQVNVVVNYDLPVDRYGNADCETYLHRIGRSGRFGKPGCAFNIVDGPHSLQVLKEIEEHFSVPIRKIVIDDIDENTFD